MMEAAESMEGEMEGGEAADIQDFFKLDQYKADTEDYSGKTNIAKLLLQQTIVNPIFADELKRCLLSNEKEERGYDKDLDRS